MTTPRTGMKDQFLPSSGPSASDFAALCSRVDRLSIDLADNTASTKRLETNTQDLVDAFGAIKGGLTVLSWVGKVGLPIGAMMIAGWKMFGGD